jgi:hypothetical protein
LGTLTVGYQAAYTSIDLKGLNGLTVTSVTALDNKSLVMNLEVPSLSISVNLSVQVSGSADVSITVPVSAGLSLGISATLELILPLHVTADGSWFVPDVSSWAPTPYVTQMPAGGSPYPFNTAQLTYFSLTGDFGGAIQGISQAMNGTIAVTNTISTAINSFVSDIEDGAADIGINIPIPSTSDAINSISSSIQNWLAVSLKTQLSNMVTGKINNILNGVWYGSVSFG